MEEVVLKATKRDVKGKQVKALRREGKLPAVIYGYDLDPTAIVMDQREASRILSHLASSALVNVDLDGTSHLALVRERQRNFITGVLTHIDFQAVSRTEKIRVAVAIDVTGESPAMKDYNGVMVLGLEELDVECLPQDLPERIVVNIGSLKRIGDGLYVRDITPPENVVFLENPDEMVVLITAPAVEEVEAPAAVPAEAGTEPEVIEKGKKEEEEEAAA